MRGVVTRARLLSLSLSLFSSCFDCDCEAFWSLRRKLHFCGTKAAKPKMHHSFEASIGDNMERLQFSFKTHFSLWGARWR
jgi:hypothetical protein